MSFFPINSLVAHSFLADIAPITGLTIRPSRPDDIDPILKMHQRLSSHSLYERYHAPRIPTKKEMERYYFLDGQNGRSLVATLPGQDQEIVAVGHYVVTDYEVAEVALLVEDFYQGRGIGRELLRQLTDLAIAQGIRFFDAYVLPLNESMLYLLQRTGQLVYNRPDYGSREVRIRLPGS